MTPSQSIRYLDDPPDAPVALGPMDGRPAVAHVFTETDIDAVNAALAAGRPLLVRGEPGVGKSQLARAVAQRTRRGFVSEVVDGRTEPRDLLYRYDAVRRLAEAQVYGQGSVTRETELTVDNFISPGPLWWAFNYASACYQGQKVTPRQPYVPDGWSAGDGFVVLLDEIDKADPSVPNGLLGALGDRCFDVLGRAHAVQIKGASPLVIITTNEERALPGAFLRRCLVHQMGPTKMEDFAKWLQGRGRAHFGEALSDDVYRKAAAKVVEDRKAVQKRGLTAPGQAEYIDLLQTLITLGPTEQQKRPDESLGEVQLDLLERVGRFVLDKHPEEPSSS